MPERLKNPRRGDKWALGCPPIACARSDNSETLKVIGRRANEFTKKELGSSGHDSRGRDEGEGKGKLTPKEEEIDSPQYALHIWRTHSIKSESDRCE